MDKKIYSSRTALIDSDDKRFYYGTKREYIVKLDSSNLFQVYAPEELADYPAENKVLDGVDYANGDLTGTLGQIIESNKDITKQIKDNAMTLIANYLTDWTKLDYTENLENNESNQSRKRYGVKILALNDTDEIVGRELLERGYEVILMDKYVNVSKSDRAQQEAADSLRTKMEELRRRFRATKFGNFSNVVNTNNYQEIEVLFDEEENIVLCKLSLTVKYKVK